MNQHARFDARSSVYLKNHQHCHVYSGSIPLLRPQTCFLSGSLSVQPGCQHHSQTPLLFPRAVQPIMCSRSSNIADAFRRKLLRRQLAFTVWLVVARWSLFLFCMRDHRHAQSHACWRTEDKTNGKLRRLQRRQTATVIPNKRH